MSNRDPFPNIDEHGAGACYCGGAAYGCAVCSCADLLVRYNKAIPRLPDGTPNMKALGLRMGSRCRSVNGTKHGLSLNGQCVGGAWGTCCINLELKAQGLSVFHGRLTWSQIVSHVKAKHPVALPGKYARFPKVSPTSYSSTVPAKGRSDDYLGAHMVVVWQPDTLSTRFIVSDSDFGSPSRPRVPPHSSIAATSLRSYWEGLGSWPVLVVLTKLPSLVTAIPWWGEDVKEYDAAHAGTSQDITAHWTAKQVAAKLNQLGMKFGSGNKAINFVDLEWGLEKRKIPYGKQVNLVDVNALMKPGTGPL